jgi:hypothetical protein
MTKSLVTAIALTIGLADYAVAQEPAHRHHQHHRHHVQPGPSVGASAYFPPGPSAESRDTYWSPAGGNPIHYAQTKGFYGGR